MLALPLASLAGGISLSSTRIIYPLGSQQTAFSVYNTSEKATYLVQSWVEDHQGNKTEDFVVTPPLYTSGPRHENKLRVIHTGKELEPDRETLYYFNSKAIPAINKKEIEGKNSLIFAATTKIKMFVRPPGLKIKSSEAPSELTFKKESKQLSIKNPTPYYMTLTDIVIDGNKLRDVMIAPFSSELITNPSINGTTVQFSTINDYGAISPVLSKSIR